MQANALSGLVEAVTPKYIFVGGKGGVGKTTCSASLALLLGNRGFKTLLLSTDPAHNVGDALGMELSVGRETPVAGVANVTALEVDPKLAYDDDADTEELAQLKQFVSAMPGIDEAMALSTLAERASGYDRVVVDTAPTGHTLRLLQLPALLTEAIARLSSWDAKLGGLFSLFSTGEDSTARLKAKLEEYREKVARLARLFTDPQQATFVCVCIAEHLSVFETARLVRALRDQHVDCRYVLVNQLLPVQFQSLSSAVLSASGLPEVIVRSATLSGARARIQAGYLWQLEQALAGSNMTIVRLPIEEGEIRGANALLSFASLLLSPRADLYGSASGGGGAAQDAASLQRLQTALRGADAAKAALAVDPVAVVMKLLAKPNGIASLCQHAAVREARAQSPTLQKFFEALEQGPAGLMVAYMMTTTDPTIKPALVALLPKVRDIIE